MKIREALLTQAPSLALQRAAQDEIARLDKLLKDMEDLLESRFNAGYNDGYYDGKSNAEGGVNNV